MRTLVGIETALLVLLSILVAGLLRSHAEILRSLHRLGIGPQGEVVTTAIGGDRRPGGQAREVTGVAPDGATVHVGMNGRRATLLAFLSSGCTSCQPLWDGLRRGVPLVDELARVVVVTRGPGVETPGLLLPLVPPGVAVVMSDQAWRDYAVPGSPYVVYVDGGLISGQGPVGDWDQLRSFLARAGADAGVAAATSSGLADAGAEDAGVESRS